MRTATQPGVETPGYMPRPLAGPGTGYGILLALVVLLVAHGKASNGQEAPADPAEPQTEAAPAEAPAEAPGPIVPGEAFFNANTAYDEAGVGNVHAVERLQ